MYLVEEWGLWTHNSREVGPRTLPLLGLDYHIIFDAEGIIREGGREIKVTWLSLLFGRKGQLDIAIANIVKYLITWEIRFLQFFTVLNIPSRYELHGIDSVLSLPNVVSPWLALTPGNVRENNYSFALNLPSEY